MTQIFVAACENGYMQPGKLTTVTTPQNTRKILEILEDINEAKDILLSNERDCLLAVKLLPEPLSSGLVDSAPQGTVGLSEKASLETVDSVHLVSVPADDTPKLQALFTSSIEKTEGLETTNKETVSKSSPEWLPLHLSWENTDIFLIVTFKIPSAKLSSDAMMHMLEFKLCENQSEFNKRILCCMFTSMSWLHNL